MPFMLSMKRKSGVNSNRLIRCRPNHLYKPSVIVSTQKNGNKIFITVSDNGMGIPSPIINKIFQPFLQPSLQVKVQDWVYPCRMIYY